MRRVRQVALRIVKLPFKRWVILELGVSVSFSIRVITAMEGGRNVDINKMLEHELCPVPLSLATADGRLRLPQNKSDLSKILRQGLPQNAVPLPNPTCTIVDGMALVQALGNRVEAKTLREWTDSFAEHIDQYFCFLHQGWSGLWPIHQTYNQSNNTDKEKWWEEGNQKECPVKKSGNWKMGQIHCFGWKQSQPDRLLMHKTDWQIPKQTRKRISAEWWICRSIKDLDFNRERCCTTFISWTWRGRYQDATACKRSQWTRLHSDNCCQSWYWCYCPSGCPSATSQTSQMGTLQKKHFVPVHLIKIPDTLKSSLLAFHTITGSDSTSQFAGIGKKSAWNVFLNNAHLLENLGSEDFPDEHVLADTETFVCRLYSPNTHHTSIQQLRHDLFHSAKKTIENLPPTQDALRLHSRLSNYQALVWKRALELHPHLPDIADSGRKLVVKDNGTEVLEPLLLTHKPSTALFVELTTCGCTHSATRRCKCASKNIGCTKACQCKGCRNPLTASQQVWAWHLWCNFDFQTGW